MLNKKSGLLALCGKSDMRDIIARAKSGYQTAQVAIKIFFYWIQRYIGANIAALEGIDAIVFTRGIGENRPLHALAHCEEIFLLKCRYRN